VQPSASSHRKSEAVEKALDMLSGQPAAPQEVLKLAKELKRELAFGFGRRILEMLNTQSALADAQMEHIRCQADWNSARLRLLASAGKMGRASVDR
jgi:outer membrane protein